MGTLIIVQSLFSIQQAAYPQVMRDSQLAICSCWKICFLFHSVLLVTFNLIWFHYNFGVILPKGHMKLFHILFCAANSWWNQDTPSSFNIQGSDHCHERLEEKLVSPSAPTFHRAREEACCWDCSLKKLIKARVPPVLLGFSHRRLPPALPQYHNPRMLKSFI